MAWRSRPRRRPPGKRRLCRARPAVPCRSPCFPAMHSCALAACHAAGCACACAPASGRGPACAGASYRTASRASGRAASLWPVFCHTGGPSRLSVCAWWLSVARRAPVCPGSLDIPRLPGARASGRPAPRANGTASCCYTMLHNTRAGTASTHGRAAPCRCRVCTASQIRRVSDGMQIDRTIERRWKRTCIALNMRRESSHTYRP